MAKTTDPRKTLAKLNPVMSPDFDAYAAGEIDASKVRCALWTHAPCTCPPFGADEYFALLDKRHGRGR